MATSKDSFSVDSDIARAWTLPSYLYTEAAAFAAEKERIFGRSWQVVGHRDRVANAGTTSRQSWPGSLC
jgi:phenylpropionate dioxygenase-like ring-hydroxylating dioxygenase large terminal subunit